MESLSLRSPHLTARLWEENPDLVTRFVRATRRGWQAYLQDPEAANAAIREINPEMDAEILAESAAAIRPLCQPQDLSPEMLGSMTHERWQTLHAQLVQLELLPHDSRAVDGAFIDMVPTIEE